MNTCGNSGGKAEGTAERMGKEGAWKMNTCGNPKQKVKSTAEKKVHGK